MNGRLYSVLVLFVSLCLGGSSMSTRAAEAEYLKVYPVLPRAQAPKLEQAPKLDGKLDDEFWTKAAKLSAFQRNVGGPTEIGPATDVWIATAGETFYIGARCHEKDMAGLIGKTEEPSWDEDVMEIFLRAGNKPAEPYHHFQVNCRGAYNDEYNRSSLWDAKKIKVAAGAEDAAWTFEMELPFSELVLPKEKEVLAGPWRLNLMRTRPMHRGDRKTAGAVKIGRGGEKYFEETAWSPTETNSSHLPHMFGYLWLEHFGGKMPAGK